MKTSLEEVIEIMNETVLLLKSEHADYSIIYELNKMIFTAESFLDKEKQQIIDAVEYGSTHYIDGENYFISKFKKT